MRFRRQRADEVSINLTPLIDVVFLLLIFFMVATTFTRETRLGVILPEADGQAATADVEGIEVVVTANGQYRLDGETLPQSDRGALRNALARHVQEGAVPPALTLTADAEASHQAVVWVMDVAGQLGFTRLRITTQEPSGE
ncbi:ExbD/TolR family protein [Isoalcanivorax beigongshangi]|uniref:ExbD/TolR family protein n=1 Tax=Isoalcanivorax beigongshangi TaxID=3238810 RepID=A0ABV4AG54_9GAMM